MSDAAEDAIIAVPKGKRKDKRKDKREKKPRKPRDKAPEVDENGAPHKKNQKKRKRDEVQLTEEEIEANKREKSRKKWKKRDEKGKAKSEQSMAEKVGNPIQFQDEKEQRKHLWDALQLIQEVKDLTELELAEVRPPKDAFVKPTMKSWTVQEADKVTLELLESAGENPSTRFLKVPSAPQNPFGSPLVIILARSALRAVEIIKYLMPFRQYAHLGSLFAKHKKLEEQAKFLREYHCQIAVGTPNRVLGLCENGALRFDQVKVFIVDMERDQKAVSIIDSFETRGDFYTLYKQYIRPQLASGVSKIAMF